MEYLLGIDLGTTNLKVSLIDEEGATIAAFTASYPTESPHPGWFEQRPGEWWGAFCELMPEVLTHISPSEIAGIGFSGQMHGAVFTDKRGKPLRDCITWADKRAAKEACEIEESIGWTRLKKTVGNRALAGFTLPKIIWVRENEPKLFEKTDKILLPKGYLRFLLTGKYCMEISGASAALLVNIYQRNWAEDILDEFEVPKSKLPSLCESTQMVGGVTKEAAAQTGLSPGTPVVAGAGDQQAGALGGGIIQPGVISATIGTGGQVYTTSISPTVEPKGRLHTFCQCLPNRWHIMGAMKSAGLALSWFKQNVLQPAVQLTGERSDISYQQMDELAKQAKPGSEGLVFLPYLSGERTPYLNPGAKGLFFGLTLNHKLPHLIRAVMEGVVFGMRDSLELIREINLPIEEIRLAGGGAKSKLWSQIQANVYGQSVYRTETGQDKSAYGAALLAGLGIGMFSDIDQLPQATQQRIKIEPDQIEVQVYNELYDLYKALYPALRPYFSD